MGRGRIASRSRSRSSSRSHERHDRAASSSRSRSPSQSSPRRLLKRRRSSRSKSREPSRHDNSRSRSRARLLRSSRSEHRESIRPKHQRSRSPPCRSNRSSSPPRDRRNRDSETQDRDRLGRDRDRQRGEQRSWDREKRREGDWDREAVARDRDKDRDRYRDREASYRDRDREAKDREARDRDRDKDRHGDRDKDRHGDRDKDRHGDRDKDRRGDRDKDFVEPRSRRDPPPLMLQKQSSWDAGGRGASAPHGAMPQGSERDEGFRRPLLSDDPPEVGSIHWGVVQTVKPFGVFVAIQGYRKHALVHHTQVSAEVVLTRSDDDELKVKALEYAAPAGQKVWVKILEVLPDQTGSGFKVHGSMLAVDQNDGTDLDPTGQLAASRGPGGGGGAGRLSDEPPDVHSVHRGEVKRIEAYGVFVALQGYRRYGLVHASQVANYLEFSAEDSEADRKKALGEVVEVGQSVFVKVVEVTQDDRGLKIGCSMKLVDQADGTDLDPQNLRYRPRGEAGHGPASKAPVGASAGEVKGGTIDWGYLATRPDAFGSAGYALLQEEPEQQNLGQTAAAAGARGGYPPPPQQQQQQLLPVGRGRGAVMPAWMSQGPAAPGSAPNREPSGAAADMTVEEALRIIQAATGKGKKKHKEKHKQHKKSSKRKSHKSKKSKHIGKKGSRSRSHSRGHGSSSDSDSDSRSR